MWLPFCCGVDDEGVGCDGPTDIVVADVAAVFAGVIGLVGGTGVDGEGGFDDGLRFDRDPVFGSGLPLDVELSGGGSGKAGSGIG